jgi:DNA-binding transcriptional LysR family regulator
MDTREFSKVDLNLLISLQVLLEEKSVSRAAERLFITQPAMSKTLSRLRALFDDALFTRSGHGMEPTPRAIEISGGLDQILGDISQLLGEGHFNPESFKGEVTLALSEHVGVALVPALVKKLNGLAPQLSIRVITRLEHQLEELTTGNLDFAIHVKQGHYGPDYRVENLGGSQLAILVREAHPLARGVVTWERLSQFPLIKLYVSDREQLEVKKKTDRVMPLVDHNLGTLEISALLTALEVLRQTDYFMPAPAYLLQEGIASAGITGRSMPRGGDLNIEYALVAHKRTSNSPLHNWLWDQITCTIAELRTQLERQMRPRMTAGRADPQQ